MWPPIRKYVQDSKAITTVTSMDDLYTLIHIIYMYKLLHFQKTPKYNCIIFVNA